MSGIRINTEHGERDVYIPPGWIRVALDDVCKPGDRYYDVKQLRFADTVESDHNVGGMFFELLIRRT